MRELGKGAYVGNYAILGVDVSQGGEVFEYDRSLAIIQFILPLPLTQVHLSACDQQDDLMVFHPYESLAYGHLA